MSAATPSAGDDVIRVRVDYDFSSSLCYVAHRVLQRLAAKTGSLGLEFGWSPIDLAAMLGWPRGAAVEGARRANTERVSRELGVPLRMPTTWLDSRNAHAVVVGLDALREPSWRERVFSAVFEEGRGLDADVLASLAADLDLALPSDFEPGRAELEVRTRAAVDQEVSGAPNFMLGPWPFGGIQTDDTMLSLFERYASRERERRRQAQ